MPFTRSEPGDVRDRVPLGRPGEQRRGDQDAHVHDLRAQELHARTSTTSSTARTLSRDVDGPDAATTRAIASPDGQLAPADPRRRHDRRHRRRPRTCCCRTRPDGQLDGDHAARRRELAEEGQQAGLVLWSGEDPNTFAKIVFINKGATSGASSTSPRATARRTSRRARRSADAAARPTSACARTAPAATSPRARSTARRGCGSPGRSTDLGDPEAPEDRPQGVRRRRLGRTRRGSLYFRVDCSDRIAPDVDARRSRRSSRTASSAGTRRRRR